MTAPVRWGICGTGGIAEKFVQSLGQVPDARVVSVASRTAGRAEDFACRLGIPRASGSPEVMAADPDVDVVYVASTHDRHRSDTILFLEAGRHVLCEKPIATSAAEAREMCDAARTNGRFLMEAMWSRFQPSYTALGRLLDDGTIGHPMTVTADFSFSVPEEARAKHRLFDPDRAGGALLDLGVYTIHLARLVLGDVAEVTAAGQLTDRGVDRHTTLGLVHRGGGVSRHHVSITRAGDCAARIKGTRGSIALDPRMHRTERLTIEGDRPRVIDTEPAGLHHQVPEVHRCIRAGVLESDRWSWDDAVATLTVIDEARSQIGLRYPWEQR